MSININPTPADHLEMIRKRVNDICWLFNNFNLSDSQKHFINFNSEDIKNRISRIYELMRLNEVKNETNT